MVDGKIEKVELVRESSGKTMVRGIRTGKDGDETGLPKRFTLSVMPDTQELQQFMRAHDVNMRVNYSNPIWGALLVQIMPILIFLGLLYFIFIRQARASGMGAMNFGKSRAKMLNQEKPKITFANVAGIEEAKDEVAEIIEFLKAPQKFVRLGGRIPRGCCRAARHGQDPANATAAGRCAILQHQRLDFVEMFVGGRLEARSMFERARSTPPDHLHRDRRRHAAALPALRRPRTSASRPSTPYAGRDGRLRDLGWRRHRGGTNRPDVLDPALQPVRWTGRSSSTCPR